MKTFAKNAYSVVLIKLKPVVNKGRVISTDVRKVMLSTR